jgi:hypothetical protein
VSLIRDVSRSKAPASPIVYSRLRALGYASRLRASAIERAAQEIASASEAYVVIEGPGAVRAAALLRELAQEQAEYPHESGVAHGLDDLHVAAQNVEGGEFLDDDDRQGGGLDDDEIEDDEDEFEDDGLEDDKFEDPSGEPSDGEPDELDAPSKRRDF